MPRVWSNIPDEIRGLDDENPDLDIPINRPASCPIKRHGSDNSIFRLVSNHIPFLLSRQPYIATEPVTHSLTHDII